MARFVAEKPALLNRLVVDSKASLSFMERFTRTIFYERSIRMLFFDFGKSDRGKDIADEISRRIMPSLYITVPTFFIGIVLAIFFAMLLAYSRGERVDKVGMFLCVVGMSISALFYIIAGQVVFGKILKLFPVSGYEPGFSAWRFVLMPVLIAVLAGLGRSIRFYRTVFLEEMNKDYVRTARAKGVRESKILFTHILKNAMIPILTGVVVELPFLITGSLLLESFFAIPGMGAYLLEAIQQQDFAVVQAMVTLGSYLYIAGLLLTDISYTFVDPRVRLQ
ncbi:MAG: ABC transporter permease [Candidatus Hydrogenedentota bacterium]|nr:MAG: ABC transporter permease [Candidatus Hydrogenedentota bacterium]